MFDFLDSQLNQLIAVGTFAFLAIAFIVTMVKSEWRRGDNWWKPNARG